MESHVYKKIEIVGSSPTSVDDAVRNAITKAGESIRGMRWFEVAEVRGDISDGRVGVWQVTVKIGFRLEE